MSFLLAGVMSPNVVVLLVDCRIMVVVVVLQ